MAASVTRAEALCAAMDAMNKLLTAANVNCASVAAGPAPPAPAPAPPAFPTILAEQLVAIQAKLDAKPSTKADIEALIADATKLQTEINKLNSVVADKDVNTATIASIISAAQEKLTTLNAAAADAAMREFNAAQEKARGIKADVLKPTEYDSYIQNYRDVVDIANRYPDLIEAVYKNTALGELQNAEEYIRDKKKVEATNAATAAAAEAERAAAVAAATAELEREAEEKAAAEAERRAAANAAAANAKAAEEKAAANAAAANAKAAEEKAAANAAAANAKAAEEKAAANAKAAEEKAAANPSGTGAATAAVRQSSGQKVSTGGPTRPRQRKQGGGRRRTRDNKNKGKRTTRRS